MDWWQEPSLDLLGAARRNAGLTIDTLDPSGLPGMLRFNHLQPPFDNPAIRRALLGAVNQADFMQAMGGADHSLWKDDVGFERRARHDLREGRISPQFEHLRDACFEAPDLAAQKAIAVQIQQQAFQDVPYLPTGEYYQPTAYRKSLSGS